MADKEINFTLNLDAADFIEQGLQAKGVIETISEAGSLEALTEGLLNTTLVLGTLGAAAYAFKEAIDLTIEGEQIEKVQKQFETLADTAGISASELKSGLEESAAGLISNNDLLQIANKAMISLGSSAERLPEVMDLARKATSVMGGDLKTNFENMSRAVETGNTRILRQYGIMIDTNEAVKKFAEANNIAANALSESGRRQAILNEVLAQGQKNYAGISGDLNTTQTVLESLKVTMNEVGEAFTLFVEKKIGPSLKGFLGGVKNLAHEAKESLLASFGTGTEQTQAQISQTEQKLLSLQNQLFELKNLGEGEGIIDRIFKGKKEDRITKLNSDIAETTAKLEQLRAENTKLATEEKAREAAKGPGKGKDDLARREIELANEAKFQAEMLKLKKDAATAEQEQVESLDQIEKQIKISDELAEQEHQAKIRQIKAATYLNDTQKKALLNQEDANFKAQENQREAANDQLRTKLLDQYVKNSQNAFQGIARAFQQTSIQNKAALTDFGKRGQEVMTSFQNNAVTALQGMGQALVQGTNFAQSAADAMKSFFLGMLADRAQAEGTMLLLSSIWPPNPLGIAAGTGLITLSGALRALAGSSGGGGSVPSSGVSTGAAPTSAPTAAQASTANEPVPPGAIPSSDQAPATADQQRTQRSVAVHIAGNYFDTDTTRRQLMEMIRQETDATDFTYTKIGAT